MSRCRSCNAPLFWVETVATETKPGKRMPLDADPANTNRALVVENGNLMFAGGVTGDNVPLVKYVPNGEGMHRTHFATCPNANSHRRSR